MTFLPVDVPGLLHSLDGVGAGIIYEIRVRGRKCNFAWHGVTPSSSLSEDLLAEVRRRFTPKDAVTIDVGIGLADNMQHVSFFYVIPEQSQQVPQSTDLLSSLIVRVLHVIEFVLPSKVKREVYEPAFNDLLEDFVIRAREYNTEWPRRWLKFCLLVRVGWMVIGSLWTMVGSVIRGFRQYLGK